MNLDWILNPLTVYSVLALVLAVSIVVLVSANSAVSRLRRVAAVSQQDLKRKIEEMESAVANIGQRSGELLVEAVPARSTSVRPGVVRSSLNLTRRTQVLQMWKRGESIQNIATAVAAPRNEIELLLKVYEMVEYRRQLKAAGERAE